MNSEYSFFYSGCLAETREPVSYLFVAREKIIGFQQF